MRFAEFKDKVQELMDFAEGWRGRIYVGFFNGNKVAIKIAKSLEKVEAIRKESKILEQLKGIKGFPQIILRGEDFFVYKFIEGITYGKAKLSKEDKKKVLKSVLEKAYFLDKLGINRDEFSNIRKNVLIDSEGEVYVIDFDRGTFKKNPSNVRQFLQFLRREGFMSQEWAIDLGKRYKEDPEKVIEEIRKILT